MLVFCQKSSYHHISPAKGENVSKIKKYTKINQHYLMHRMNNRDSDGFFSRRLVCRSSDRSYNSTG